MKTMANLLSRFRMRKTGTEIEIADAAARDTNTEQDSAIQANASAISEETTNRTNADNGLNNAIKAETKRAEDEENTLSNSIDDNAQNIATLSEGLQNEINRATNAENTNAQAITTETNARTSADNALNQRLTATNENVTANASALNDKADKSNTVENVTMTQTDGTVTLSQTKNGESSEIGSFTTGSGASGGVTNVSITNENGVYTFSQTKDGTTTEIGTVETSKSNNPVIEVKDSIVENNTSGYDFHTLQETTEDATENDIVKLYLAQKQITGLSVAGPHVLSVSSVDQAGNETKELKSLTTTNTSFSVTIPTNVSDGDLYVLYIQLEVNETNTFTFYMLVYVDGDYIRFLPNDNSYTGRELSYIAAYTPADVATSAGTAEIVMSYTGASSLVEANYKWIKIAPVSASATSDTGLIVS